jgi:hypothetical protein
VAFPKAYGLTGQSEVISPSSFEKMGGTPQRSQQGQDSANLLPQGTYGPQARQGNRSEAQQATDIDWVFENGRWVPVARAASRPTYPQSTAADRLGVEATTNRSFAASSGGTNGGIEWVFQDGRWVPVPKTGPSSERSQPDTETTYPSRTTQRPEVTGPVETYPRSSQFDLSRIPAPRGNSYSTTNGTAVGSGVEWVFQDGRWVPVQRGGPETGRQLPTQFGGSERVIPLDQGDQKAAETLTWEEAIRSRLIRIPTDKLLAGDPRYNIVIQPGDTIHVPVDIVGECCIMGNVTRAGYLNLTGRPMTLKMAIAAAGGLGPLAFPKNCEVVRRIGDKREEIVLVDLDKIASGEQPDFFIKPNDLINVGTHYTARWRAVLRNAFRATYGFGFVYDRNFADADYGKGWPNLF